jgi:polar amino acid transport system ATP-binding protein
MSGLVVSGLAKRFGARVVFEGVSFAIAPGEALALLGPSGSGKTTLLRCLNGLERADQGTVDVDGDRLSPDADERQLIALRRRLGFVFQASHLFAHRTVLENVMEGPRFVRAQPPVEARREAEALLEEVGVAHRAAAYPRELSGGEQQRAAIARALAMRPEVLVMDEPTSALDDERVDALVGLLRRLTGEGLALLAATHDRRFADALAGRMLRLEGGQLR